MSLCKNDRTIGLRGFCLCSQVKLGIPTLQMLDFVAGSKVLLVDESKLNDALILSKENGPQGVIVLLNSSTSTNQDAKDWNPRGSGSMWKELEVPVQALGGADADRIARLAQANDLQARMHNGSPY